MKLRTAILAALIASAATSRGAAQDPRDAEVRARLNDLVDTYVSYMEDVGYGGPLELEAEDPVFGALSVGKTATHDLELAGDVTIFAACDSVCGDVDLELFDAAGNLIGSDAEEEDYPGVFVKAQKPSAFSLRVRMVECSAAACRYGFRVLTESSSDSEPKPPPPPPNPPSPSPTSAPAKDTGAAPLTPQAADGAAQVQAQLDAVATEMSKRGFRARPPSAGALKQTQSATLDAVELDAGRNHLILAACDRDCTDLDLRVFDAGGTLIDSDLKPDDAPVVEFIAPITGPFRLVVTMVACNHPASKPDGCRYGVQVFHQ